MTSTPRSMADGEGVNAAAVIAAGTQLVGTYATGSGGVPWTPEQRAEAVKAGKVVVVIDQAGAGAPQYWANVQDVEPECWTPASVPGWQARCTAPRPTVYCDRSDLPAVLATGWRGDLWLADPSYPGQPLPPLPPGCTYVAVQNVEDVGGTHDLSVVLDPYWPLEAPVTTPATVVAEGGYGVCEKCGAAWFLATKSGNVCPAGGPHVTPPGWENLSVLVAR